MNKKSQLKSAYIDGEMSVTECLDFEATLSQEEIEMLKADMKFEDALGQQLNSGPKCPDDLWQSLKAQMEDRVEEEPAPLKIVEEKKSFSIKPFIMSVLAAAAAVIVTISLQDKTATVGVNQTVVNTANPSTLWDVPVSLSEFNVATLKAQSIAEAQLLLTSNDFQLTINAPAAAHHKVDFLGASEEVFNGEKVVALHYACCGKPLKVIVTCKGSEACKQITKSMGSQEGGIIQSTLELDKYRLALIGHHRGEVIFNSIDGPQI